MINTIFWDFDGVLLDSMNVRDWGFKKIFKGYDNELINDLISYHRKNGGLSRYVKIKYFFEELVKNPINDQQVLKYAEKFSSLMRKELTDKKKLIVDSLEFVKKNYNRYNFHIVSGSDQKELRFLCKKLEIHKFFISIHGSPIPKKKLVSSLIEKYNYKKKCVCLIGDSINDFEAANDNNIEFFGYNNDQLKIYGNYINTMRDYNF